VALVGADDAGERRIATRLAGTRVVTFGVAADATARLTHVEQQPGRTSARVRVGGHEHTLTLRVPGLHNLRNATAALLAAHELGADLTAALDALARFTGVGRRFERVGAAHGVEIVDDYAHHPTELAATLEAARQAFPGRRVVAVFQPHLYSRTQQHGEALGVALAQADVAVVTEIYAAREQPVAGVSGRQVADAAERAGTRTLFVADKSALPGTLEGLVADGDVVFTLGAGDITRVGPALLRLLEAR
jgi:UDP-N-acetylmuramate--alanine ligase